MRFPSRTLVLFSALALPALAQPGAAPREVTTKPYRTSPSHSHSFQRSRTFGADSPKASRCASWRCSAAWW